MATKSITKYEFLRLLAEETDISMNKLESILRALGTVCVAELKAKDVVTIPGIVKLTRVVKKALPERPGVNRFTNQPMTFPAKPASMKVKATAIKAFKDLAI